MKELLHIAIDGPAGAGKGTIASKLAKRFGLTYIYTGGMYRALGFSCLKNNIDVNDAQAVLAHLNQIEIQVQPPRDEAVCKILLNGDDITNEITSTAAARAGSQISVHQKVRQKMVLLQQHIAQNISVVMEGRDIGLRVLPQAQLKIYLTASVEERARRRFLQHSQTEGLDLEKVIEETKTRDTRDMTRSVDPLMKLPDAWELDTTHKTPEQVVDEIEVELKRRSLI